MDDAILLRRPQRPGGPPILIGGRGLKRTLPLAAKYVSEWNIFSAIDEFTTLNKRLSELLIEQGRKLDDVKRSVATQVVFARNDAELLGKLHGQGVTTTDALWMKGITAGTANELIDRLNQWQEAGVDRLMLQWLDMDDITGLEIGICCRLLLSPH